MHQLTFDALNPIEPIHRAQTGSGKTAAFTKTGGRRAATGGMLCGNSRNSGNRRRFRRS